jgi:PAS domain S-box-containing protein
MTRQLPATLFRRVLDGSPDAVVIACEQGKIRYINAAMLALSGYARGDVLDQPLDDLLPAAPVEQARDFLHR